MVIIVIRPQRSSRTGPKVAPASFRRAIRGLQVVAHEVELVAGLVRRVDCDLSWGQGEDEPAAPGIKGRQLQGIPQDVAGRFDGVRKQDDVRAADHEPLLVDSTSDDRCPRA